MGPEENILENSSISTFQQGLTQSAVRKIDKIRDSTVSPRKTKADQCWQGRPGQIKAEQDRQRQTKTDQGKVVQNA